MRDSNQRGRKGAERAGTEEGGVVFRLGVWARDDVKHDGETISTAAPPPLSNTIVTEQASGGHRSNLFRSIDVARARAHSETDKQNDL